MKELTGKAGNHPGLSGYALKYLAAAFMLCDHVAYFVIRRGLYAPWMSPEGGISFSDAPAYLLTANRVYWVLDILGLAPLLAASPWVALAAPLLLMYNGQRGRRGRKYFFYVFYPAHFLVLTALGRLCAKKF